MISVSLLKTVELFSGLPQEMLERLAEQAQLHEYTKHDIVLRKGDESHDLMFLLKGQLIVSDQLPSGQEVGLYVIEPGSVFGELSVIDGLPRAASITALDSSVVGKLPRHVFLSLLEAHPALALTLLKRFARVIRANNEQRAILGINNVSSRIVALLLERARQAGQTPGVIIKLPNQQQIAVLANTTRESVSRTLAMLRDKGLIAKNGKLIQISDLAALESLVDNPGVDESKNKSSS